VNEQTTVPESPLASAIGDFLSHHRALGKRFDSEEAALRLLDRYLVEQRIETIQAITPTLLEAFVCSRPRTRSRSYNHLVNVLQRLFLWLERQGILIPSPFHLQPRRSTSQRSPFLFEPDQVRCLLALAEQLPDGRNTHRRGATYRMVFALMYALGLRVGEAARLCRKDVDRQRQCLIICQSKFAKSRLLPFGPKVGQALDDHLRQPAPGIELSAEDPLFSLSKDQRRPIYSKTISGTFQYIVAQMGLTVPPGIALPRLHCLRHSFAVATLLRWYRSGVDPAARLNHLSTFLGHVNPASTSVYLTITAELLEQANARFERFAAPSVRREEQ
jgi:site-specific recombinase XerD